MRKLWGFSVGKICDVSKYHVRRVETQSRCFSRKGWEQGVKVSENVTVQLMTLTCNWMAVLWVKNGLTCVRCWSSERSSLPEWLASLWNETGVFVSFHGGWCLSSLNLDISVVSNMAKKAVLQFYSASAKTQLRGGIFKMGSNINHCCHHTLKTSPHLQKPLSIHTLFSHHYNSCSSFKQATLKNPACNS